MGVVTVSIRDDGTWGETIPDDHDLEVVTSQAKADIPTKRPEIPRDGFSDRQITPVSPEIPVDDIRGEQADIFKRWEEKKRKEE